jgi:hypothetical protein
MNPNHVSSWLASFLLLFGTLTGAPRGAAAEDPVDAASFVCRDYKHGVPYIPARTYQARDVEALLRVLADPANEPYWANTIITLGIIGDERATQPIIDFLERRFEGEVSLARFNALLSAPLALGHAARHGNEPARDYLVRHPTLAAWEAKELRWTFQRYRGHARSVLLAKMVIRALAFACKPETKAVLLRLRDSTEPDYVDLRRHALADITEAIEFYEVLDKQGPEKTFVYTEPAPATPSKPAATSPPGDRP